MSFTRPPPKFEVVSAFPVFATCGASLTGNVGDTVLQNLAHLPPAPSVPFTHPPPKFEVVSAFHCLCSLLKENIRDTVLQNPARPTGALCAVHASAAQVRCGAI